MRVVAGQFKGRRIAAPRGGAVRPTADRVREALFSMLPGLSERKVLDLFAGSGALGIEALSRGAAAATFVDRDPRAVTCVRRNLAALGAEGAVHRRDALAYLAQAGTRGCRFDLIFLDPPYSSARDLRRRLSERLPSVLGENSLIVTESDRRMPLDLAFPSERERDYGDTRIVIHRGP